MSKNEQQFHEDKHLSRDIAPQHAVASGISIENVLADRSKDVLLAEVEAFVTANGLSAHLDAFRKGALVAQNPQNWQSVEELSEDDRKVLEHEDTHKWSHPFKLYYTGRRPLRRC